MAEHDLIDAPDAGAHAASNGDSHAAHVVIGGRKLSIE
jgi:histidine ammonia-lyase